MIKKDVSELLAHLRKEFEKQGLWWAFFAGFAVKNYAPAYEREITDIDILCESKDFEKALKCLEKFKHNELITQKSIFRLKLVDFELSTEIEVVCDLVINKDGKSYNFFPDELMKKKCKMLNVDGTKMPFLAPEDVIAFKLVSQRGSGINKRDFEDVSALFKNLKIDKDYLFERAERMKANDLIAEGIKKTQNI